MYIELYKNVQGLFNMRRQLSLTVDYVATLFKKTTPVTLNIQT